MECPMSRWDPRSFSTTTQHFSGAPGGGRASRLARSAGRALPGRARRHALEPLESRVLLAGDHPSFSQFPLADPVTLSGTTGEGTLAGVIEANLEPNDM